MRRTRALRISTGATSCCMAARALLIAVLLVRSPAGAQQRAVDSMGDTAITQVASTRGGSEFWIPFGSVVVPGLGQYIHGEPWVGLGYTATAVAGAIAGLDA